MKKAIILIIVLMLMLTACNQTPPYESENAKKYQYFYFQNLDWGMSREECLKNLSANENDLLPADERFKQETDNGFTVKKEVYGYPAQITCLFTEEHGAYKGQIGLVAVAVVFEKDKYDITKIFNQWVELVDYSKYVETVSQDSPFSFSSNAILESFEDEIAKKKFDVLQRKAGKTTEEERINLVNSKIEYTPNEEAIMMLNGYNAAVLNYALKQ